MRHPISVQPPSTYQSSNHKLRIFIIFIRRHVGAYHGPNLIFHPVTVTCNITCASFEVMRLCRVVVLWGILGRARDKCNTSPAITTPSTPDIQAAGLATVVCSYAIPDPSK